MCDTFCIRTSSGMLFAKSSDRPFDEPQVLRWFDRRGATDGSIETTYTALPDRGSAAVLGSQPTWMWGFEHGLNEHGVAIGNEKVFTVDDPHGAPPALLGMDLVRLGLERGRDADGALEAIVSLLADHGQGGSGERDEDEPYWSSFLIADARRGWVLETSDRSWVAKPVGDGAAISNRLTLRRDWTRSSRDLGAGDDWDAWRAPDAPTGIADQRLAATRACVARGSAAMPSGVAAALRDHGSGPWGRPGTTTTVPPPPPAKVHDDWTGISVCMHVREYQCTTSSMVVDLRTDADAPMRVWASLGTPCSAVFLPVGVLEERADGPVAVVPTYLSDPDRWARWSRLSRLVEQPGDQGAHALAEIRAALDPIEAEAWASAEVLWSTGAGAADWRSAAAGWDAALDETLDRLEIRS